MTPSTLTLPNVLGMVRLLLSPGLIVLGALGDGMPFLILFLFLEGTDWLDGKLAIRLNQRTRFGARLDTVADMTMYGALLVGLVLLEGQTFLEEWPWMLPAVVGFAASWSLSFWKFGVLPSYHAWSAKLSWLLAVLAAVALLAFDRIWPVRVAAMAVTLANVEAIALTLRLDRPRSDVRSIFSMEQRGPRHLDDDELDDEGPDADAPDDEEVRHDVEEGRG
ncbi:MAG: CDP-alcohol phosphatidyltransferase family protein [Longimicrobiales bacterium]|nr:CDP-alcohol phosphatidyltransferase family protein [Longimicrobiales bacterium]